MQKDIETRIFSPQVQNLRVEFAEDGRSKVTGLAVPYNQTSEDLGGFREMFNSGAFSETLTQNVDVAADVEHDSSKKLGRRKNGTLDLRDSTDGLYVSITLPKTSVGNDIAEEVRSGLLDGMSIAFTNPTSQWIGKGIDTLRKITKADLRAVTLTSSPAYRQTIGTVTLRSLEEHIKQQQADEEAAKPKLDDTPIAALRERIDLSEPLIG